MIKTDSIKDFFQRLRDMFVNDSDKPETVIAKCQEDISLVKAAFDDDFMELEEYLTKMKELGSKLESALLRKSEVDKKKDHPIYADAIIRNSAGDILFLRRNNDSSLFPKLWGLPGGHVEDNEDPEQAAKREAMEETGKKITSCFFAKKLELDNGAEIYYYHCDTEDLDDKLILDNAEHFSYEFIKEQDYDKYEFIPGLLDILKEVGNRAPAFEAEPIDRAEAVDLVTFSDDVIGANCGNCQYFDAKAAYCTNKAVDQAVTVRMCCGIWNAPGTKRAWEA